MSEPTIDWNKPVQTRSGRKVRVLCTDLAGDHPVVAAITYDDGSENVDTWTIAGRYHFSARHESGLDLVQAP